MQKVECEPIYQPPYYEEDEIDLRELFGTIWRNKFKLFLITTLITSLTLIYVIVTPNSYTSKTILVPKEQSKPSIGGGAAALASMAGINLGGSGGGIDVANLFKNLIEDYPFNREIIIKYRLDQKLDPQNMSKHMVFVLNGDEMRKNIINFFSHIFSSHQKEKNQDEIVFEIYKKLKKIMSVSTDKESGAITLSATVEDRFLAKELVEIYLREMSEYIKKLDFKEMDAQLNYYQNELSSTTNVDLKQNITELISSLIKKKVLSQAGEYYMVKQLTKPEVAYIKDKTKPKRALILVVAFITSIILGIFWIFFMEFLKGEEDEDKDEIEIDQKVEDLKEKNDMPTTTITTQTTKRESDLSF